MGGTLLALAMVANVVGRNAADDAAADAKRRLRGELALITNDELDAYPETKRRIEDVAERALTGSAGRVVGTTQPERPSEARPAVVVAVEVRWAWEARCIRAELRRDARVITQVDEHTC